MRKSTKIISALIFVIISLYIAAPIIRAQYNKHVPNIKHVILKERTTPSSEEESSKKNVYTKEKDFPDLSKYDDLRISVSLDKQEMYIFSGKGMIFIAQISSGRPSSPTPTGDYVIENERGEWHYNERTGEGMYYWVSFKDHGIYLFHSLPTDINGKEDSQAAKNFGQPVSNGCIRLSRTVAKWFYENIPEGTPVIIA